MIVKFTKFNEASDIRTIDSLKEDITNVFSYISDDYNVDIQVRMSQVIVEVKSIIPSSIIYDDFEDYVNKSTIWNEVLLDINVAIKQLMSSGGIEYSIKVNTVGNVIIKFHILNDTLFISNNTSITISKYKLNKLINDNNISEITKDNCDNNEFLIHFKTPSNPENQIEISEKVKGIFSRYGIERSNITIGTYQYDINTLSVKIRKRRDTGALYKRIRIQSVL